MWSFQELRATQGATKWKLWGEEIMEIKDLAEGCCLLKSTCLDVLKVPKEQHTILIRKYSYSSTSLRCRPMAAYVAGFCLLVDSL